MRLVSHYHPIVTKFQGFVHGCRNGESFETSLNLTSYPEKQH